MRGKRGGNRRCGTDARFSRGTERREKRGEKGGARGEEGTWGAREK